MENSPNRLNLKNSSCILFMKETYKWLHCPATLTGRKLNVSLLTISNTQGGDTVLRGGCVWFSLYNWERARV